MQFLHPWPHTMVTMCGRVVPGAEAMGAGVLGGHARGGMDVGGWVGQWQELPRPRV